MFTSLRGKSMYIIYKWTISSIAPWRFVTVGYGLKYRRWAKEWECYALLGHNPQTHFQFHWLNMGYIYIILGVSHPKTIGFPIQIHPWKIVQLVWDVAARSFSMILLPAALRGGHGSFWSSEFTTAWSSWIPMDGEMSHQQWLQWLLRQPAIMTSVGTPWLFWCCRCVTEKKKTKKNDADGLRNISEDQGEPSSCKFLKHEICYFHVGLSEKMVPLNHIISLDIIVPLKTFFGYIYDGICHSETQP